LFARQFEGDQRILKQYQKVIGLPKMSTVSLPLNVIRPSSMPLNNKIMEVEEMEKSNKETKKIKRQTKAPATTEAKTEVPKIKKPSEDEVLEAMEVGVLYTSSQLADALKLSGETRRDKVRKLMAKLAKEGKIRISEVTETKRKQFLYELAEK